MLYFYAAKVMHSIGVVIRRNFIKGFDRVNNGLFRFKIYNLYAACDNNLTDLPPRGGPPVKLESGGYGRPDGLTGTQCRADHQGEARWFLGPVVYSRASYAV